MKVEQILSMNSKNEACFILFETDIKPKCTQCKNFHKDSFGAWKCENLWNQTVCRKEYEFFLEKEMDLK